MARSLGPLFGTKAEPQKVWLVARFPDPREDPKVDPLMGGSYNVPYSSTGPQIRGSTF